MKVPSKPASRRATAKRAIPKGVQADAARYGFEISPVTGLPVKPLAAGQKPVSREALKAALENVL